MKIGIIGCGKMGRIYAAKLATIPSVEAIYTYDTDPAKSADGTIRVDSLDTILEDPSIEAVLIASSTDSHALLARQCLDSGKHVLLEKPISLDAKQAQELVRQARHAERVLMVCHQLTLNKQFAALVNALSHAPAYSLSGIKAFRRYPCASDADTTTFPPLASDEGPHALSLVFAILHACGKEPPRLLSHSSQESTDKSALQAHLKSGTGAVPVNVELDFQRDKALASRQTGIEIKLHGPAGETTILWDEAAGQIRVMPLRQEFASLEHIPLDTDPLKTLLERFVGCVADPRLAEQQPDLSGATASRITALHEAMERPGVSSGAGKAAVRRG